MENSEDDEQEPEEQQESESELEEGVKIMRQLQELDKNMDVRMEEDDESVDLVEGVRLEFKEGVQNWQDSKEQDY